MRENGESGISSYRVWLAPQLCRLEMAGSPTRQDIFIVLTLSSSAIYIYTRIRLRYIPAVAVADTHSRHVYNNALKISEGPPNLLCYVFMLSGFPMQHLFLG